MKEPEEHDQCKCSEKKNKSELLCKKCIERERESILNYFKQQSIQSITFQGDNSLIEYQNSTTETKPTNSSSELQKVKSYAESLGKNKLSLSDLEQSNNPSNSPKSNKLSLYIGLAVVAILVVGIIVYFLTRKKDSHGK